MSPPLTTTPELLSATQTLIAPPNQQLSLIRGSPKPDLFRLTLGELVDQQAEKYGNKDAVLVAWTNTRLSFRDVCRRSKELARSLMALGVGKGDRIAVFSGDDERFVDLFFAAGRIGAVLVILNKTYTLAECLRAVEHTVRVRALRTSEPKVLFISDIVNRRPTLPILRHIRSHRGSLQHVVLMRWDKIPTRAEPTWDDVLAVGQDVLPAALEVLEESVDVHSLVNFQFTSGTTGAPKAAMLSHFNVTNNGYFVGECLNLTPEDVVYCGPPLFHCFGLVCGLLGAFTHGASIALAGRDFEATPVVEMLARERCTVLHGVPTMFTAILEEIDRTGVKIDTLVKGIAGGAKVPPALLDEIEKKLGYKHVGITYGMTETSPASFMTSSTDTRDQKLETVGQPLPHVTAKVVDVDNRIVPRGVRGELCVSGYLLQQGYFQNPEKTAEAMIRDDDSVVWMHTGDEAVIDEQGYCHITGRIKDTIIRGGENIYPLEIEERLLQHPAIHQVSVVGLKDEKYGEAVSAFLQLREGHEKPSLITLRKWVQEELGRHKAPQHAIWVGPGEQVPVYPTTGTGKIRKDLLRAAGEKILEATDSPLTAKL